MLWSAALNSFDWNWITLITSNKFNWFDFDAAILIDSNGFRWLNCINLSPIVRRMIEDQMIEIDQTDNDSI